MKIGFSLGRCVRDIVDGVVSIDDVLLIVSRASFSTAEGLDSIIEEYMFEPTYLRGRDKAACIDVARKLWSHGQIHMPRAAGVMPLLVSNNYIWFDVVPTTADMPANVADAWKSYKTVLALSATDIPDK